MRLHPAAVYIPDFVKVANRTAPTKPVALTRVRRKPERKRPFHLPKTIEPAGLALLKEIEAARRAKEKAKAEARRSRAW